MALLDHVPTTYSLPIHFLPNSQNSRKTPFKARQQAIAEISVEKIVPNLVENGRQEATSSEEHFVFVWRDPPVQKLWKTFADSAGRRGGRVGLRFDSLMVATQRLQKVLRGSFKF